MSGCHLKYGCILPQCTALSASLFISNGEYECWGDCSGGGSGGRVIPAAFCAQQHKKVAASKIGKTEHEV